MSQRITISVIAVIILIILIFIGCGDSCRPKGNSKNACSDFVDSLVTKYKTDEPMVLCIDAESWKEIESINLDRGKTKCVFCKDRKIDKGLLTETFVGLGYKVTEFCEPLKFKFYLEASASMYNYDKGNPNDFRSNIEDLVGRLGDIEGSPVPELFYVNDTIYECPIQYDDFVNPLKGFYEKEVGDKNHTNFSLIFSSVVEGLSENEVAFIASDLIYSDSENAGDIESVRRAAKSFGNQAFKSFDHSHDVLLVKYHSNYDGLYYFSDDSSTKIDKKPRPYYLVVIAGKSAMKQFLKADIEGLSFARKWSDYAGYEHYFLFTDYISSVPKYSFLPRSSNCRDRMSKEGNSTSRYTVFEELEADRDGEMKLAIAVNFDDLYFDDNYLTDTNNYRLNTDEFELLEVVRSDEFNSNDNDAKYWDAVNPSHVIVLSASSKPKSGLKINLIQRFPQWVEDSHCPDDSDINSETFQHTTLALKDLFQGIFDAYYSGQEPVVSTISLEIRNN